MARQLQTNDQTFEVREDELDDVPEADAEVVYVLRELTTSKWRELNRQHTKKRPNKKTGRMEDETDGAAFSDALVDYVIVDWRGVVDHGEPAPCTRENKLRLDGVMKTALVNRAGLTQIVKGPEHREQSFRPTDGVG